jgi:ketosteroid isomerase-like protein
MSQENVENARRAYAALNEAYRSGNVEVFRPTADELWDPDVMLATAVVLPDSDTTAHGIDAVLRFLSRQMQAFEERTTWMEPLDFIDAGDHLIVPYRFGGRARHTGIEVEFSFAHVFTIRNGMTVRIENHPSKAHALQAVGLSEQDAHAES